MALVQPYLLDYTIDKLSNKFHLFDDMKVKDKIKDIIERECKDTVHSIHKIDGLGIVNQVYDIQGTKKEYIIRLNDDLNQFVEYKKEKWCLNEVSKLNISCPRVLKIGKEERLSFMIQEKLEGKNGTRCSKKERRTIWFKLGEFARTYNKINRIRVEEVNRLEFHKNWKSRLRYNIEQLNIEDKLLKNGVLSLSEHERSKMILRNLETKEFTEGLVHADLGPKNVIMSDKGVVFLLDWGTAGINVVPHHEIGLVILSKEANNQEFDQFLKGYGISKNEFEKMYPDILILNFLNRLDKYRWAESYDPLNLKRYEDKIRKTFDAIHKG